MRKYIYILTDCRRNCLHVGYSENLISTVGFYKEKQAMFFSTDSIASRLVYIESYYSEEEVIARFNEMKVFTRQQKEQLIRSSNPNWNDLSPSFELSYHPGAKLSPNVPNLTSFR